MTTPWMTTIGLAYEAALEDQHERSHRVEHVDPSEVVRIELLRDRLERIHDRAGPEPSGQHDLNEVLSVTQVHVDGGKQDRQSRREEHPGEQRHDEQGEVGRVGGHPQHDHEDDHHQALEEEEDAGGPDRGEGQDLPRERHLLHDPGVVHHDAGTGQDAQLEEVEQEQTGEQEDHEVRHLVAEHDLEYEEVDRQRHGRSHHRPDEAERRVLVLDLDFGADQVDQELARKARSRGVACVR